MSIDISKISYFSFAVMLNNKKEMPLKKIWFGERVYKKTFAVGRVWSLIGRLAIFQKTGAWQERRGEKERNSKKLWFSLKLSFMNAKDHVNLNIFLVALFIVCLTTQCVVLTVQCFFLRRNIGPSFFCQQRIKVLL